MTFTPYDFQAVDLAKLKRDNYRSLINIEPGGGKGHPLDEPVLTPGGWTPVGNLRPGDFVVGSDGKPTEVLNVYDRGTLPVYRVTFRDGSSVRVDGDHLWQFRYSGKKVASVADTRHLYSLSHETLSKYFIPTTYVDFPEKDLPLEPYLLGGLLADGYLHGRGTQWTKKDTRVVDEFVRVANAGGIQVNKRSAELQYGVLGVSGIISRLGLKVRSAEKFIPDEYKIASREQRVDLLAGLFDGDGSVRKDRGTAYYSTTSAMLASDVQSVLWSLGVPATKRFKSHTRGGWWEVSIHSDFNPFRAASKVPTGAKRTLRRSFSSIELIGSDPVRCIRVAAKDHLYVTKDFIVTHNTALGTFAIRDSGASVSLIIAPDQTHKTAWQPTVADILGTEARVIGNTGKSRKEALADFSLGYPGVYLASPQFFTRADISDWTGDMCIVDEGHLLNSAKSKVQRKLSGYSFHDGEPLAQRFDGRLFLSGTSWRNSFERAWATMRFLFPDHNFSGQVAYDNYYGWLSQRMSYEDIVTGWEQTKEGKWVPKTAKKWMNEKVPGRLISEAPSVITHFRRTRCCDFHPNGFLDTQAPQEIRHVIELAPAQKKAITELEDHYMTYLDNQPLTADLTLTQQQRIRQLCLGVPEVEYFEVDGEEKVTVSFRDDCVSPFSSRLFDLLEELDDEPVVVYLESQRFASVLTSRLNKAGVTAFEYSGKTRDVRDDNLSRFGTDYRVAVVVIAAGGTGLDGLQRVTKTEVWFERSVDETLNVQAEARADRIGGIAQVQRHIFLDSEGRAQGRMSAQLEKRRALARTLRVG